MKILFILPWVPYPLNSGGNQAFFNMVDAIRKEHEVSVVPYCYSIKDKKIALQLQNVWPDVDIDAYSSDKDNEELEFSKYHRYKYNFCSWIEKSMRRKKNRIVKRYEIQQFQESQPEKNENTFSLGNFVKENSTLFSKYNGITPEYLEFIYKKSRQGYDLIQVEFYECLPVVYVLPENIRKVFVHHELRFIRNNNEAQLFKELTINDEIKLKRQKDEELSALSHFNDIIVLTEKDKSILTPLLPKSNIYVSPALTNASEFTKDITFKKCSDLVFMGGGAHFPNADGILWFAMYVMPKLKENGFNANVYVTGKWNDDIQSVVHSQCKDIIFKGFVEDLYDFINGKIVIVPIRIGSGMRMKLIDAMAAKSPVVTTQKGCEGLPFTDAKSCFVADDAQTFAQDIITLQNNTELQESMVNECSKNMCGILDSNHLLETRLDFYRKLQNNICK